MSDESPNMKKMVENMKAKAEGVWRKCERGRIHRRTVLTTLAEERVRGEGMIKVVPPSREIWIRIRLNVPD